MSNSVKDTQKSIDDQLKYLNWLKEKTGHNIWNGRIFQLERMRHEIKYQERKNTNGVERT